MALGNGSNFNGGPLIFLSPRSKDALGKELDQPYFEVARVGEDKKIAKTEETFTEVGGDLIKIDFKERETKGGTQKHVVLYIRDDVANETYSIDLTHRIASRSLFNMILSLENFDNLKLSYYRSKKGYEAFSLRQNADLVKWKIELSELPKAKEYKDDKGKVIKTDYSAIDDFFEEELKVVAAKLGGKKSETKSEKKVAAPAATKTEEENSEDTPF